MLYMVIERFRQGRAHDVYRRFRDRGRLAPDGRGGRGDRAGTLILATGLGQA
jgi:hypothetical protein